LPSMKQPNLPLRDQPPYTRFLFWRTFGNVISKVNQLNTAVKYNNRQKMLQ
jgi:hypothetical protein